MTNTGPTGGAGATGGAKPQGGSSAEQAGIPREPKTENAASSMPADNVAAQAQRIEQAREDAVVANAGDPPEITKIAQSLPSEAPTAPEMQVGAIKSDAGAAEEGQTNSTPELHPADNNDSANQPILEGQSASDGNIEEVNPAKPDSAEQAGTQEEQVQEPLSEEELDDEIQSAEQQVSQTPEGQSVLQSKEWDLVKKQLKEAARNPNTSAYMRAAMESAARFVKASQNVTRLEDLAKDPQVLEQSVQSAFKAFQEEKDTVKKAALRDQYEELRDLGEQVGNKGQEPKVIRDAKDRADDVRATLNSQIGHLRDSGVGKELLGYLQMDNEVLRKAMGAIIYKVENEGLLKLGLPGTFLAAILEALKELGKQAIQLPRAA